MVSFDDLLEEAGAFGHFQKRIFCVLCLLSMPFAAVYVGIVFQGFTPNHWCRLSGGAAAAEVMEEKMQECGWSLEEALRKSVPLVNVSGDVQPSSCLQYQVDWNSTTLGCDPTDVDLRGAPVSRCKVRVVTAPVTAAVFVVGRGCSTHRDLRVAALWLLCFH